MVKVKKRVYVFLIIMVLLLSMAAYSEDTSSYLLVPPFLGKPTRESIAVNLVAGDQEIVCHLRYGKATESKDPLWQKTEDCIIKKRVLKRLY